MTTWIKQFICSFIETRPLDPHEVAALQAPQQDLKYGVLRRMNVPERARNGDIMGAYRKSIGNKKVVHHYDNEPLSPIGQPIKLLPFRPVRLIQNTAGLAPVRASTPKPAPQAQHSEPLPETAPRSLLPTVRAQLFTDVPKEAHWTPADDEDQPPPQQRSTKQIPAMDAENSIRWLLEDCKKQNTGEQRPVVIEEKNFLL